MAAIVGRAALTQRLKDAWAQTRLGGGQVLVLLGDAGIGKSRMLSWLHQHTGHVARKVTCYGGTAAAPMSAAAEVLAALGIPEQLDEIDPLCVAETLSSALDSTESAVLLIDDIHDADPSSRTALSLALRRASVGGVLAVVTGRRVPSSWRFAEGFPTEQLDALPDDEAVQVLDGACDARIPPEVARQLLTIAAGNPLALTQLPRALSPAQLSGAAPLPDELPLTAELHTAFTRQLPAAGTAARDLLDLAAVSCDESWPPLAGLLGASSEAAVAQLTDLGLATLAEGRLRLRHPLLRTATLRAMPQDRRRELNSALASAMSLSEETRLMHRALATAGPDEDLADQLVDAAHMHRLRGGTDAAARALDRAVDLTGCASRRAFLQLEAAALLGTAGEPVAARHRLEALLADPSCRDLYVAATLLLATLEAVDGAPALAWQRLTECLAAASPTEVGLVHARMALPLGMLGLVGEIVSNAEAAVEHSKPNTPEWSAARITLAHAASAQDEARANELVDDLVDTLDLEGLVGVDPMVGLHVGRALSIAERYSAAAHALQALTARLRGEGARTSLAMAFGALGELQVRASRFDEAATCLDEAVALSLATGQRAFAPFWLSLRGRVRAIRGDDTAAQDDLQLGFGIAQEMNTFGARYFLLANAGLAALTAQRPAEAVDLLEECWMFEQSTTLLAPQLARWHPDLVEAYVSCGRAADAKPVVEYLDRVASTPGASRWTRAGALRARAVWCAEDDPAGAVELLEKASDTYDLDVDRFDRARTLTIAARLHTAPQRRSAARKEALYAFRRLGAAPWAAQVSAMQQPDGLASLTPTEHRVLAEVAKGLTNRQIAKQLDMSSKTVANHLYQTYRKLGVASRTEAARYLLLAD